MTTHRPSAAARLLCGLLCLLLTGCSAAPGPPPTPPAPTASIPPAGPEAGEEPTPVPAPEAEAPILPSAILEAAPPADGEGRILRVPCAAAETGIGQEIVLFGEDLLLWGYGQNEEGASGCRLRRISLADGQVLGEAFFPGLEMPCVQVCGDRIALSDWASGRVTLLDAAFTPVAEYGTDTFYDTVYVNAAADRIYCFTQEGVRVIRTDDGSEELLFGHAVMLYPSGLCGSTVSLSYTDRDSQRSGHGAVDLDTGEALTLPYSGAFRSSQCSSGLWLSGLMEEGSRYALGRGARPQVFSPREPGALVSLLAEPLRILSTAWDDAGRTCLTLYDPDGRFLSRCALPDNAAQMTGNPLWSEADGGYFIIAIDAEGHDILLFWDLAVPAAGADLQTEPLLPNTPPADADMDADLLRRAEELGASYGVTLLLGDAIRDTFTDFVPVPESDPACIAAGLDAAEAALALYPEGFLGQLLYGDMQALEICLTGPISLRETPEDSANGFTTYVGCAEAMADRTVLAVDITAAGSVGQTLHHELMHAIEFRMAFDARIREDALFSEDAWAALNPEGFAYTEDRLNLPEDIYTDGYDDAFIDVYSRTSALEDRGRIMEYAMIGADWAFSGAGERQAKLEYLCRCIRDAFDTAGWPDRTPWEATLDRSRGA